VVFDPVAVGATDHRKTIANGKQHGPLFLAHGSSLNFLELLNTWQPTVIKGNAGEIGALLGNSEVSLLSRSLQIIRLLKIQV